MVHSISIPAETIFIIRALPDHRLQVASRRKVEEVPAGNTGTITFLPGNSFVVNQLVETGALCRIYWTTYSHRGGGGLVINRPGRAPAPIYLVVNKQLRFERDGSVRLGNLEGTEFTVFPSDSEFRWIH